MNKVYDFAEKLTKTLSNKVNDITKDKTLDEDTRFMKLVIYGEVIDDISRLVTKTIRGDR